MSGTRFWLLTAALGLGVAAASFAAGLALLDDGGPDPPPPRPDTTTTTPEAVPSTTSTTPAAPAATGELVTPALIVVVASEGTEEAARARADAVAARGHPTGVLRSDDYESLNPGLWVAYAGPYPDRAAADAAVTALAEDGIDGAYVRCAGTRAQCRGGGDRDGGEDGD